VTIRMKLLILSPSNKPLVVAVLYLLLGSTQTCGIEGIREVIHLHELTASVTLRKPYSLTHEAEPFSRSTKSLRYSRTSQHFMEPEGSLPCSKEPSTGPYPEPYHSNPYHLILSL
jgi:hypothetical protein